MNKENVQLMPFLDVWETFSGPMWKKHPTDWDFFTTNESEGFATSPYQNLLLACMHYLQMCMQRFLAVEWLRMCKAP